MKNRSIGKAHVNWFTALKFGMLLLLGVTTAVEAQTALVDPYLRTKSSVIAITNVRVIDGTGAAARPGQTVVIANGLITAIGRSPIIPLGAEVIDASGESIMPGYVETHNHLFTATYGKENVWHDMPYSFPRLYLGAGVTTMRTTGSMDMVFDVNLKNQIDFGSVPGPSIMLTSPYLTGPGAYDSQMIILNTPAEAISNVDYYASVGATSFKVYENISREVLSAVISEAHKRGLKVVGHLCSVGIGEAADLGIDWIEHGVIADAEFYPGKKEDICPSDYLGVDESIANLDTGSKPVQDLIRKLISDHVGVSSTLAVFDSFSDEGATRQLDSKTLELLAPEQAASVMALRNTLKTDRPFGAALNGKPWPYAAMVKTEMRFEKAFVDAGGMLTTGPDPSGYGAVVAGVGDWRSIELLTVAGFTPLQALHIATENGAKALGVDATTGTLQVGKVADAILVHGSPDRDINAIENVDIVFKKGKAFDSKSLFAAAKGLVGRQ